MYSSNSKVGNGMVSIHWLCTCREIIMLCVDERVGDNDTQTMGREAHQARYYFRLALPGARGGM